jgi:hypothetical protein
MNQPSLQQRAAAVGLSMARLCRESGVRYDKIAYGRPLFGDEERAVESVLDRYRYRQRIHPDAAAV